MKKTIILLSAINLFVLPLAHAQQTAQKELKVPFKYALGKSLFEQNCAACHGKYGNGSDKGPTFMSPIYKPGHHGDEAFYRAPMTGAKAHHWKFGDMPPVEGISRRKLSKIVPYIRWMQQQNGIR
jgi:cytochrome c2